MSNANCASNHHESMQTKQAKCSLMHEHVMEDAMCMNLWLMCRENTNAQRYMHAMYKILTPTRIRRQNPIQIKQFKSTSSRFRIYIEFACNFSIQFQENLKVRNS